MQLPALSLLLLVLPWAGADPASGEHGEELRTLQDLLEALGQLWEEEEEPELEEEPVVGAEDEGSKWDPPAPSPPQRGQGQSQWRSLLSSYRRRHFSSCFGTRMERIGAQTGLGCNQYQGRIWRRRRS
ncbi:natriuretic peptides A-like [Calypte anna]|uniref:natriuretic peptides A-like n=1 Tax=Calypte anna TaxID=9244 RepID=UPI0004C1CA95|nr:natriuretic peptides A-like [Calypte anna]